MARGQHGGDGPHDQPRPRRGKRRCHARRAIVLDRIRFARYRTGYSPYSQDERHRNRRDRALKVAIEAPHRQRAGITRFDQWPPYFWPGGYDAIYYVALDPDAARRGDGGTLCALCLNERATDTTEVVIGVDFSGNCDEPEYCEHCGKNIGGPEDGDTDEA
jgi:hypothetical protein